MSSSKNIIAIPSVVYRPKDGPCSVFVPDLNITIHGVTFVDTLAETLMNVAAIITYRRDRNVPFNVEHTYDDLVEKYSKAKDARFIYMLTVDSEG